MLRLILGGSFDPIHWGHLRPLVQAFTLLQADEMLLLPSAQPPHRHNLGATAAQRLAMAQLAAAELAPLACRADDWELRQSRPSYSVITLAQLQQRWPHDQLVFALGADAFAQLDQWYQWQQLLDHAHILVLARPQQAAPCWSPALQQWLQQNRVVTVEQFKHQPAGLIGFAETSAVAISASVIRTAIANQQPWRQYLPQAVADYIEQQQLYR